MQLNILHQFILFGCPIPEEEYSAFSHYLSLSPKDKWAAILFDLNVQPRSFGGITYIPSDGGSTTYDLFNVKQSQKQKPPIEEEGRYPDVSI